MKIANIDREILHMFWATWGILMKFSEKDVTCDKTKSHKKPGFQPLFRRCIFRKTRGEGVILTHQAVLGLKKKLLRKGMSNISLKVTTEKKIRSQNFDFLSLKSLS